MILASAVLVLVLVFLTIAVLQKSGPAGLALGASDAWAQGRRMVYRLPLALLAASFLSQLVPFASFSHLIGPESGLYGILLASVLGGFIPGGPMISFPIAVAILDGGAGWPQTASLIAGWSILAVNRTLAYEAPVMGWRFTLLRLAATAALPLLAGMLVALMLWLVPLAPILGR